MDYIDIIKKTKKYHYLIKSTNKVIYLSGSNKKSEAKTEALKKILPNIDNLIGKNLIFIIIKLNNEITNMLKSKSGPIILILNNALIKNKNKIKNLVDDSNNIYLSDKFIKKNSDNLLNDYKQIIKNYYNEKLNKSLIDVTVL